MSDKKIGILYHRTDLDGHASAAIVEYYYSKHDDVEVFAEGIDYSDDFDTVIARLNGCLREENEYFHCVYVVDFSILLEDLAKIWTLDIVVIDHHETALKKYDVKPSDTYGYLRWVPSHKNPSRDIALRLHITPGKEAACALVWKRFFNDTPPPFIQALSDYDSWHYATFPEKERYKVLAVQYGMRPLTEDLHNPEFWSTLFSEHLRETDEGMDIIQKGYAIWDYVRQGYKRISCAFSEIDGHRLCLANAPGVNSLAFQEMREQEEISKCPVWMTYSLNGRKVRCTLFQNPRFDVHVGLIAEMFGGGGHPGAAGFPMDVSEFADQFLTR